MGGPGYVLGTNLVLHQLDNFNQDHPFKFRNKMYVSAEQAYQSLKFEVSDPEYSELIRNTLDKGLIWMMGHSRLHKKSPEFESYNTMFLVNLERVKQNKDLQKLLACLPKDAIIYFPGSDKNWGTNGYYPIDKTDFYLHSNNQTFHNNNGDIFSEIKRVLKLF